MGLARHCAAASRPNSSTNAGWIPRVTTWDAVDQQRLGPPSPKPSQIFAVGVNYAAHSDETGIDVPAQPMIFIKFASSLTGPVGDLSLPTDTVDWEIELVAVIGRTASNVSAATAWDHVAGLTVGQGMSERTAQMAGTMPQFSLAKSYPGFAPTGPHLVTPDEMPDLDDVKLRTLVNGDVVQDGTTRNIIFTVPALIASLSAVCPLLPGDLIFTGTPDGVGMGRTPPTYLRPGDELTSHIDGIGTLRQRCQAGATPSAPQLAHAGDEQR